METLPTGELWVIKTKQVAGLIGESLRIRMISDMLLGTTALSPIGSVFLLGSRYGEECASHSAEELQAIRDDFSSRIWCSYRRLFPPLGDGSFTSDNGWGCTLRTGQMLVAEALSRQHLGRGWRRVQRGAADVPKELLGILETLDDSEGQSAPLSIHSLCNWGREHGVLPGRWLGPWTLCKTLEAALECPVAARSSPVVGSLRVHVVCDPGGGAPTLDVNRVRRDVFASEPLSGGGGGGHPRSGDATSGDSGSGHRTGIDEGHSRLSAANAGGMEAEFSRADAGGCSFARDAALASSATAQRDEAAVGSLLRGTFPLDRRGSKRLAETEAGPSSSSGDPSAEDEREEGCLVPRVVTEDDREGEGCIVSHEGEARDCIISSMTGHGVCQTECQTKGQRGGASCCPLPPEGPLVSDDERLGCLAFEGVRPGAAALLLLIPLTLGVGKVNELYLPQLQRVLTFPQSVGIVGGRPGASLFFVGYQGDNLVYLDPHETQPCAPLTPASARSFFCDSVRLMPMTSMDPSLAIGFHCQTLGDFEDLCSRLRTLCADFPSAPLLTVSLDSAPVGYLEAQYRCLDEVDFACDDEEEEDDNAFPRVSCHGPEDDAAAAVTKTNGVAAAEQRCPGRASDSGSPTAMALSPSPSKKGARGRQLSTRSDWEVLEG